MSDVILKCKNCGNTSHYELESRLFEGRKLVIDANAKLEHQLAEANKEIEKSHHSLSVTVKQLADKSALLLEAREALDAVFSQRLDDNYNCSLCGNDAGRNLSWERELVGHAEWCAILKTKHLLEKLK